MKEEDDIEESNNINNKEYSNINNQDIENKIPAEISIIKEENKSLFCSGVSLQNNNNEINNLNKNAYNTNTYNIEKINSNEINNNSNIDINDEKELNIESDIKILTSVWKQKLLISGYYEYEILFTKKDTKKNKILTQRTLYRNYDDINILYQGLILYNPGCLIPKVPENSNFEKNKEIQEEKKNQIENYLGYICKHIYLSKNPIFLIFISDEFERYKLKINDNKEKYNVYSLIKLCFNEGYKFSKNFFFNKIFSSSNDNINKEFENNNINLSIEISDKRLRDEKLRLEKIISGTDKFINALNEEINSVSEKISSMKKLHEISDILKDSNFRVELNNIDEKFLSQKNFFSLESIVYQKMAENYEIYVTKIKKIYKNLIKYKEVTESLTEAFIRKEKVELEFNKEKNSDFSLDKNHCEKIRKMSENYRNVEIQFFEELSNFHKNIENMFTIYANEYIDIKNKTDKNNQIVLMNKMNKSFNTPSNS